MANRNFDERKGSMVRGSVELYCKATIGASGVVTAIANNIGITSVARTGAGAYTITLNDPYNQLLVPSLIIGNATAVDLVPQIVAESVATTKLISFLTNTAGTPTDPPSGAVIYILLSLKNSSVLP